LDELIPRVWDAGPGSDRQPREEKVVTISRIKGSLTFSANFQLIAATNPAHGVITETVKSRVVVLTAWLPDIKSGFQARYWIDIHIEVPRVDYDKLSGD
jgi:magnesium chelatase family protein